MNRSSKRRRENDPSSFDGSSKQSRPPLTVDVGEVMFRLVCPLSLAAGLIGKSGAVIQYDTSSKILIEESLAYATDGKAVIVVGPKNLTRRIDLVKETTILEREDGEYTPNEVRGEEKVVEVSPAQEAIIRVFERMVERNKEKVVREVRCRMLAEASQVGRVIGIGGKVIDNIRGESRCKIWLSNVAKDLPLCALPNDRLMEMEGDVLAVKRALIAITGHLQEYPPLETTKVSESRPCQTTHTNFLNSLHHDGMSILPSSSYLSPPRGRYSTEIDPKTKEEEVVFRILCSIDRIGGVIGEGGNTVHALENKTGAAISAGDSVPDCDECLITITAKENPESQLSPAQNAIVLVFRRSIEAGYEKGLHSVENRIVSARIVVPVKQVGCLIGNKVAVITNIRIIEHDKLPRYVAANDVVLEITGEVDNVQEALLNVTSLLRQHIFSYNNPNGHATRTNFVTTERKDKESHTLGSTVIWL